MYQSQPMGSLAHDSDHGERQRQLRKPSKIRDMTIKRAANKGYIVTHSYDNSGAGEAYRSPEDHAFGSHHEMLAHVTKWATGQDTPSKNMIGGQKAAPSKAAGRRASRKVTHGGGVVD